MFLSKLVRGLAHASAFTSAVVAVTTTISTIAPTKATPACTPTALNPPPSIYYCGQVGNVTDPSPLFYGPLQINTLDDCRDACLNAIGCHSFGLNSKMGECTLYSKGLKQQKLRKKQVTDTVYYNKHCFKHCPVSNPAQPAPATSNGTVSTTPGPVYQAPAIAYAQGATAQNVSAEPTKQFVYGNVDAAGNVFYALVDLTAPDGSTLVSLESFTPFVSSVQCSAAIITITFNDSTAFSMAETWPEDFYLVTTGPVYCGNGGNRTFYHVMAAVPTPLLMEVALTVQSADISEAVSAVNADFGTAVVGTNSIQKRTSVQDVISYIQTLYSGATTFGSYQFDITPDTFSFAGGANGFGGTYGDGAIALLCEDGNGCGLYATGSLYGNIGCSGTSCSQAQVGLNLDSVNVVATFTIQAGEGLTFESQIPVAALDLFSFVIPDIIDIELGASLVVDIYVTTDGGFSIGNLGGNFSFTGDVSLNAVNQDYYFSLNNFAVVGGTPSIGSGMVPGSITFGVWTGPKFDFSISVPALSAVIPGFDADVYVETPRIQLDLNRVVPGAGCGNPTTAIAANLDVTAFIELHAGASGPGIPSAYADVTLANATFPLVTDACVTLG